MIYEGTNLSVTRIEGNIAEIVLDAKNDSVNKFDHATLAELGAAVAAIAADGSLMGCLLRSAKPAFVVGADITEFLGMFASSDEFFAESLMKCHRVFNGLEDLPMPVVCAINGFALGGGLEVALACDYRIGADDARLGLPETKLGIFPGFGGTIRLPRLIGSDNAIEWIATASENKAEAALAVGVLDAVVPLAKLRDASLRLLHQAIEGKFNYRARRAEKTGPLPLSPIEAGMVFEGGKAYVASQAGPHYPAPVEAVKVMQKSAGMHRDEALKVEMAGFMKMARTATAKNLIGIFLSDQYLKKVGKKHGKIAREVKRTAVLGAGIMGGGIAYQSASRAQVPVLMKDIRPEALQLGMSEASKLLGKLVELGKLDNAKMAAALTAITPTLSYADAAHCDFVVEAVVESEKIKRAVLAEVESHVPEHAVIASNTSTISITRLGEALKRPERFIGMHFFNPVHKMPLVEIIRGKASSDEAIATAVAYAQKMGKNPIVVNDCPGFLVNRILFPYFSGFNILVGKGGDYRAIDKVMEKFGWPMGPAYLNDVVGLDTAYHAAQVMAEAFPARLASTQKNVLDLMYERKRFGQKTGSGFYKYELDKKGKPKKVEDPEALAMVQELVGPFKAFDEQTIVDHLMIPMVIEAARCLEDGIVATPMEVDMGLVYGIGFPPFRGGALRYADELGLAELVRRAEAYAEHGELYQPTAIMKSMAAAGKTFYSYT